MVTERLEVRLDADRKRKLAEIAKASGRPVAAVIRDLIDSGYEEVISERRRLAAEEIKSLSLPVPSDPGTLARELERMHDPNHPDPLY